MAKRKYTRTSRSQIHEIIGVIGLANLEAAGFCVIPVSALANLAIQANRELVEIDSDQVGADNTPTDTHETDGFESKGA